MFFTMDPAAGFGVKQVLYAEGDEQRGLCICIEDMFLHVTGWNKPADESGWGLTHIENFLNPSFQVCVII